MVGIGREGIHLVRAWMARVCSGHPSAPLEMYSNSAVLIPTFADIRVGRSQIQDYFVEFMAERPGLCGRIDSWIEQKISRTSLVVSGVYTFGWVPHGESQVETASARFSYVCVREGGRWRILNHHSSGVPEQPPSLH